MNDSFETSFGTIIVLWLVFWFIYWFYWGEVEWTVHNIDNCQVNIIVKDVFYNKIFRKFVCTYEKTKSGDLINGVCYNANFNNNWICTKLIKYTKRPALICNNWYFLSGNWLCYRSFTDIYKYYETLFGTWKSNTWTNDTWDGL